jgi:cytosine/adenosine deaminase-related metal-dependent hydrolase
MKVGGLDSRTVAAHAINISRSDIVLLEQTRTSIIWCPSSNMFLFGRTAPVKLLLGRVPVALGTDSTLTGSVTLFEEMRAAQAAHPLSAREILQLVTESPRGIFGLPDDVGEICSGGNADLFLLPSTSSDPYETILRANPGDISLMMRRGRVVFFDETRFPGLVNGNSASSLLFDGRRKIIRDRRCAQLYNELRPFLGHYSYLSPQ